MLLTAYQHLINAYSGFSRDVWLLTLVNFVNRVGGMVVVFLTIYLTQDLGFSLPDAGWVLTAFGLGSVLGSFLGGQLTDRFSYFYIQLFSLCAQGVVLLLLPLFTTFWSLTIAVFFLALISDLFRPANTVAYIQYSRPENRTRAFSLARLAFNLGFTIAPAIGGFLVPLGWFFLFWADGITCFAAAGLLFWFLKPKPRLAESPEIVIEEGPIEKSAYKNRTFLNLVFLNFFAGLIFMQLIWTIPVYFRNDQGYTEPQIGLLMGLNGLVVALVEMPLIFAIENKRSKLFYIRLGVVCYMLTFLLLTPSVVGWVLAASAIFVISIGEIMVMPFSTSYVTQIAGPKRQGQYMALYGISYSIAHILSPLIGTQVAGRFGFSTLWIGTAVLAAALWLGYLFFERRFPGDPEVSYESRAHLETV